MTDEIENNSAEVNAAVMELLKAGHRRLTAKERAFIVKHERTHEAIIEEGLIGLGKSSVTKDPQAEPITFDCTRNENQTGDEE